MKQKTQKLTIQVFERSMNVGSTRPIVYSHTGYTGTVRSNLEVLQDSANLIEASAGHPVYCGSSLSDIWFTHAKT